MLLQSELWKRYTETILEFGSGPELRIDLRDGPGTEQSRRLAELGLTGPFAILTACDPDGSPAPLETNRKRTRMLERDITAAGHRWIPTDGVSPDGSHREAGVAVACGQDRALELGRGHGQLAIYWYDGRRFWLLPCDPRQRPIALPPRQ